MRISCGDVLLDVIVGPVEVVIEFVLVSECNK